ncbi:hypothetical protein TRIUR3_00902 [Triticum urartu]|uniref:Uncharacterized protein n=1 Tax=Triticum urartu TaxID=4572 RepID=M7YUL3_TRIUA|nr:hypothetical protein TRIUR3_00902 [Triticum urartu]
MLIHQNRLCPSLLAQFTGEHIPGGIGDGVVCSVGLLCGVPIGPYNYDVLEGMTFDNIYESFNADFEDGTIGQVWIFESILHGEYGEGMNIEVLVLAERRCRRELLCRCRGSAAVALSSGSVAAALSSGSAAAALWSAQIVRRLRRSHDGGDPDGLRRRDPAGYEVRRQADPDLRQDAVFFVYVRGWGSVDCS